MNVKRTEEFTRSALSVSEVNAIKERIAELEIRITRKDARIAELEALLRTWADDRAVVMGISETGLV
jgi:hypothetical protein